MAFIIFQHMHSFHTQRFMQKPLLTASRSLTIKDHTLTELWLTCSFTINLTNQLTFSIMILISCSLSSNDCMLIQSIWFMHSNSLTSYNRSIQINQQTLISKIKHQPLNKISALFNQAFIQATKQNITVNWNLKTKLKFKNWNINIKCTEDKII